MNYITIILFVIVICMCLYFYREFVTFQKDVYDKLDNAGISESGVSKKTLDEIRKINLDCMNQIRKMNVLQNQTITNSNHFTDSDSDDESNIMSNKTEKKDTLKQDSLYISNEPSVNNTQKTNPILEITTKPTINDEIVIDSPQELVESNNIIKVDNIDSLNEITDPKEGIIFDNYNSTDDNEEDEEDDEEEDEEDEKDDEEDDEEENKNMDGGNKEVNEYKEKIRNKIIGTTCENYLLEDLKQIVNSPLCKIPLSKKLNGKWKALNKQELFDEIKKFVLK